MTTEFQTASWTLPSIQQLLQELLVGNQTVEQVSQSLLRTSISGTDITATGDVRIDSDRALRCGYPEVIYAPGKSTESLIQAFQKLLDHQQNALATRCDPSQITALSQAFPDATVNLSARTVRFNFNDEVSGKVMVVSAGTSDRPVAEETLETLRWMNVSAELLLDVGVAGPQRFLQEKHRLDDANAVVVVAGMEGALPSVVGGWVRCPVIAVPTSVGYGAAFGGLTALLGMLNSCAANVAVVNIDAGFKAGYLAGMIAQQAHKNL
ncbi:MAG TPA: nickel pincer cofactor biosynthesis protein LarB [Planctomicrobium sp.]|nr:nickel pincer cofactor biosynthesis protein LarB [Planctomicrobium sp.]